MTKSTRVTLKMLERMSKKQLLEEIEALQIYICLLEVAV